jgi:cytochrome c nitrite reductase small subunit
MRQLWRWSKRQWIAAGAMAGLVGGLGVFTFDYGEGLSYLGHAPETCVNCHIMRPQYDSWRNAGHRHVATCQDCHVPTAFVPWLIAEADNGYRHSKGFTFQNFPEPIRINRRNSEILQQNCIRCHGDAVHELVGGSRSDDVAGGAVSCVHCHKGAGHGQRFVIGRAVGDEMLSTK